MTLGEVYFGIGGILAGSLGTLALIIWLTQRGLAVLHEIASHACTCPGPYTRREDCPVHGWRID